MNSSSINASKLALGTVQFGLDYGVANQSGRVTVEEGQEILAEAHLAGVDTLDTAIAYGDSEATLGKIGVGNWRIVSKLPKMPENTRDVYGWVETQIAGSLSRLGIAQLDGLLLHYPAQVFEGEGCRLLAALQRAKDNGFVKKIGASIYSPNELPTLLDAFDMSLVQLPLNILDRRFIDSGWLARMSLAGVEVHVRSIFLQGLLLLAESKRPGKFSRWHSLWTAWDSWLKDNDLSALEACLGFVLQQEMVSKIVIGVDCVSQIRQILSLSDRPFPDVPNFPDIYDEKLINPANWSQL
jgi:aryl-alcohol dehydrogenase-like predicted oxidoreductase